MKICLVIILLGVLALFVPTYALATEYHTPGENGTLYAHVLYINGTPANSATVNLTLWRPNGTKALDTVSMGYLAGSNGIYLYNFTTPGTLGVYVVDIVSSNPTGYGTDEVHVSDITDAFNVTIGNLTANSTLIAAAVWNETAAGYTNTSTFGGIINDVLGGDMSDNVLLVGVLILCFGLMGFAFWRRSQAMLWVSALAWIGFTFWQQGLSTGWATWDLHEIMFYVGLGMVIVCVVEAVMMYREEQPEPVKRTAEEAPLTSYQKMRQSLRDTREKYGIRRRGR